MLHTPYNINVWILLATNDRLTGGRVFHITITDHRGFIRFETIYCVPLYRLQALQCLVSVTGPTTLHLRCRETWRYQVATPVRFGQMKSFSMCVCWYDKHEMMWTDWFWLTADQPPGLMQRSYLSPHDINQAFNGLWASCRLTWCNLHHAAIRQSPVVSPIYKGWTLLLVELIQSIKHWCV